MFDLKRILLHHSSSIRSRDMSETIRSDLGENLDFVTSEHRNYWFKSEKIDSNSAKTFVDISWNHPHAFLSYSLWESPGDSFVEQNDFFDIPQIFHL